MSAQLHALAHFTSGVRIVVENFGQIKCFVQHYVLSYASAYEYLFLQF